ncbi:hypothetical protein [Veronia pacifica]|uniref:WD40 repeat protein n=1 Tax=Veronia pacifica TaxID=1080227 RepID=A0A1C3EBR8_9GAMM|nr:hypothetical protein [Veronia pacifica]ODA30683.1 hypothetical protein A8L45_19620 [Veronia pacifica]
MRILGLVFLLLFSSSFVHADRLVEFDYPLLVGEWYWFSPEQESPESERGEYKAISMTFSSEYTFRVKLLKRSGDVEEAAGTYNLDDTAMVLTDDLGGRQQHTYKVNHNQLMLQGLQFTKLLKQNLSGTWHSVQITGQDVGSKVSKLSLRLQPDFLFASKVSDIKGNSVTHRGVYFLEDNMLVLVYKNGQQQSTFELVADTLTLRDKKIGMHAIMRRQVIR